MNNQIIELFNSLSAPSPVSDVAANELLEHPEWLVGKPPSQFICKLKTIDYDSNSAFFQLAKKWEKSSMSEALLQAFLDEPEVNSKKHVAWLLKHLVDSTRWKVISDKVLDQEESIQVRRFLLEGLDRLAFANQIGWNELKDIINTLKNDSSSEIREGVVGVLMSLKNDQEKLPILRDMLFDNDDWVVASAVNSILHMEDLNLDNSLINYLLDHPNVLVRERTKQYLNSSGVGQK